MKPIVPSNTGISAVEEGYTGEGRPHSLSYNQDPPTPLKASRNGILFEIAGVQPSELFDFIRSQLLTREAMQRPVAQLPNSRILNQPKSHLVKPTETVSKEP